jgi:hypothetical protein
MSYSDEFNSSNDHLLLSTLTRLFKRRHTCKCLSARYGMVHDWDREPAYHSRRISWFSDVKSQQYGRHALVGRLDKFPFKLQRRRWELGGLFSCNINVWDILRVTRTWLFGPVWKCPIQFLLWRTSQVKRRLAQPPQPRNLGATFLKHENNEGYHQRLPMLPNFDPFCWLVECLLNR